MIKTFFGVGFLVLVGFSGYGIAKAISLDLSDNWSAGLTIFAIFLFGLAEGIN